MSASLKHRLPRILAATIGLAVAIVLAAHPLAGAATDVWSNVAPAPRLGSGGLFGRYPLSHYTLDQHFDFVSASLTGGVDVSGVPPMIAYVFASILWLLTSFLANSLITLFAFAFSLDLVNGSQATGGAGALGAVSQAIHSIYANVLGGPWLVVAITIAGLWAMWRSLVQRRHAETAGALALSLLYVVAAFFFVAQPGASIGAASKLTNQMSEGFLAIAGHGSPSDGGQAGDDAASRLFDLLVFKPWVVLDFGGLEHCALTGTGSGDADPESAPVRPLSQSPARDAALARRLAGGSEVSADGKVCINNASKYAPHFLRFSLGADGMDERGDEYDALNDGDSSELPDADPDRAGYRLGAADKPASDAMEEGGQFQRLGLALVLFVGELGAVLLLGSLSVGVILAQVLLLLTLAFSPVALIAAAIPGRGHAFFKGWLEKLAGFLLRKAAYSLILATLLAVSGALESATVELGWLMSFGLQALFFWAVFIQRRSLTEGLIGIATGPRAPGREATVRLLGLYAGARLGTRAIRPLRRGAGSATRTSGRLFGGALGPRGGEEVSSPPAPARASRSGSDRNDPRGGDGPSPDISGSVERVRAGEEKADGPPREHRSGSVSPASSRPVSDVDTSTPSKEVPIQAPARRRIARPMRHRARRSRAAIAEASPRNRRPPAARGRRARRRRGNRRGPIPSSSCASSASDRQRTHRRSLPLRLPPSRPRRRGVPASRKVRGNEQASITPLAPGGLGLLPPRRGGGNSRRHGDGDPRQRTRLPGGRGRSARRGPGDPRGGQGDPARPPADLPGSRPADGHRLGLPCLDRHPGVWPGRLS